MERPIVSSDQPVTLLGGVDPGAEVLERALNHAPRLVAIDGGADHALRHQSRPEAVIGDMDSLSNAARAALGDRLHPIAEQQTTDFDKALRSVVAPLCLAVGVTGGRVDHELAVMNTLVRHPHRPCIVMGGASLVVLCPPRLQLDLAPDTPVSLFPMGPVRVRSEGLAWSTEGLDLAPDGRIGTSNRATGPVVLEPSAANLLLILPTASLAALIQRFLGPPSASGATWPVPAG